MDECPSCKNLEARLASLEQQFLPLRTELELLRKQVIRDPLTGVLNRRGFDDILHHEAAGAHRHNRPLAIAICDVDHFKAVNDLHGHPAGDSLLKRLAELLTKHCRESDYVARLGGEEFGIILPYTDLVGGFAHIERLRQVLERELFVLSETIVPVRCTVSFGVSQLEVSQTVENLVRVVDKALYSSKRNGRNRVSTL